jgi:filamentous hemagglutinin family protein
MKQKQQKRSGGSRRCQRTAAVGILLAAACGGVCAIPASAHPAHSGVQVQAVAHGSATIVQNGVNTQISATNGAIINFKSFDIPQGASVDIILPSPSSRVYDRVTSGTATQIDGSLISNGAVYLTNPAGISFGSSANVNTASLYAIAGNLSDSAFTAGKNQFTGLDGSVQNQGTLHTTGDLVLAGKSVVNTGTITSDNGAVALLSGQNVLVTEKNSQLFATVSPNAGSKGLFGSGDLYSLALKNGGRIKAPQVNLQADQTSGVAVSGTIDASSTVAGSTGGTVSITGGSVALSTATINASGAAGGGSVNVGGDHHGNGALANADFTSVSSDSQIHADALGDGNGGNVVLWSQQQTVFGGAISVRGSGTGSGGNAEVSSHNKLEYSGTANLGAASGVGGTLLLDPATIVIDATASATTTMTTAQVVASAQGGTLELQATSTITVDASSPIDFPIDNPTGNLILSSPAMAFNSPITGNVNLTLQSPTNSLTMTGNVSVPAVNSGLNPPNSITVYAQQLSTTGIIAYGNLSLLGPTSSSGQPTLMQSATFTTDSSGWLDNAALGSISTTGLVNLQVRSFQSPSGVVPIIASGNLVSDIASATTTFFTSGSSSESSIFFTYFGSTVPPYTVDSFLRSPVTAVGTANPSPAIAANAEPVESPVPNSQAVLGSNAREKLKQLQISVKNDEATVEGNAFRIMDDWPRKLNPRPSDYQVSSGRVSVDTANVAANLYVKLFGEKSEKIDAVVSSIDAVLKDQKDLTPLQFAREVNQLKPSDPSRQTMLQLKALKDDIANLGLSRAEMESSYQAWMEPLVSKEQYSYTWFEKVLDQLQP